jgi:hypothetical protein
MASASTLSSICHSPSKVKTSRFLEECGFVSAENAGSPAAALPSSNFVKLRRVVLSACISFVLDFLPWIRFKSLLKGDCRYREHAGASLPAQSIRIHFAAKFKASCSSFSPVDIDLRSWTRRAMPSGWSVGCPL